MALKMSAQTKAALAEFDLVSTGKGEMAQDFYDSQDEETQEAIDTLVGTLMSIATGSIDDPSAVGRSIKVPDEQIGSVVLWIAVEITKDLALCGARVANFKWPANLCAECGSEVA